MIGVTGAGGYLGSRIVAHLRARGLETLAMTRSPQIDDPRSVRYRLGEDIDQSLLEGVSAIIHAAHDLTDRSAKGQLINTVGALPLLRAARLVSARVIFLSSLSAYVGCRSNYGRAKIELERMVFGDGGFVLRAGVIFGHPPGGIFQNLEQTIGRRRLLPLPGGGVQPLYVSYDETICKLVASMCLGETAVGTDRPVFAAHEVPTTLRDVAIEIATRLKRSVKVLPIPAKLGYVVLAGLEAIHIPVPFSSDSLVGLAQPIPIDQIAQLDRSDVEFPPLTAQLWS